MNINLQICEGANQHCASGTGDSDDGGCQPVADRQCGVDDGQRCVSITGERTVILRYTVQYGFLQEHILVKV